MNTDDRFSNIFCSQTITGLSSLRPESACLFIHKSIFRDDDLKHKLGIVLNYESKTVQIEKDEDDSYTYLNIGDLNSLNKNLNVKVPTNFSDNFIVKNIFPDMPVGLAQKIGICKNDNECFSGKCSLEEHNGQKYCCAEKDNGCNKCDDNGQCVKGSCLSGYEFKKEIRTIIDNSGNPVTKEINRCVPQSTEPDIIDSIKDIIAIYTCNNESKEVTMTFVNNTGYEPKEGEYKTQSEAEIACSSNIVKPEPEPKPEPQPNPKPEPTPDKLTFNFSSKVNLLFRKESRDNFKKLISGGKTIHLVITPKNRDETIIDITKEIQEWISNESQSDLNLNHLVYEITLEQNKNEEGKYEKIEVTLPDKFNVNLIINKDSLDEDNGAFNVNLSKSEFKEVDDFVHYNDIKKGIEPVIKDIEITPLTVEGCKGDLLNEKLECLNGCADGHRYFFDKTRKQYRCLKFKHSKYDWDYLYPDKIIEFLQKYSNNPTRETLDIRVEFDNNLKQALTNWRDQVNTNLLKLNNEQKLLSKQLSTTFKEDNCTHEWLILTGKIKKGEKWGYEDTIPNEPNEATKSQVYTYFKNTGHFTNIPPLTIIKILDSNLDGVFTKANFCDLFKGDLKNFTVKQDLVYEIIKDRIIQNFYTYSQEKQQEKAEIDIISQFLEDYSNNKAFSHDFLQELLTKQNSGLKYIIDYEQGGNIFEGLNMENEHILYQNLENDSIRWKPMFFKDPKYSLLEKYSRVNKILVKLGYYNFMTDDQKSIRTIPELCLDNPSGEGAADNISTVDNPCLKYADDESTLIDNLKLYNEHHIKKTRSDMLSKTIKVFGNTYKISNIIVSGYPVFISESIGEDQPNKYIYYNQQARQWHISDKAEDVNTQSVKTKQYLSINRNSSQSSQQSPLDILLNPQSKWIEETWSTKDWNENTELNFTEKKAASIVIDLSDPQIVNNTDELIYKEPIEHHSTISSIKIQIAREEMYKGALDFKTKIAELLNKKITSCQTEIENLFTNFTVDPFKISTLENNQITKELESYVTKGKEELDKSFKEASEYKFKFPNKHEEQLFIRFLSNGKMDDYLSSDVGKNKFAGKGISNLQKCLEKLIEKINSREKTIIDLHTKSSTFLQNYREYVDLSMNNYFVERLNSKFKKLEVKNRDISKPTNSGSIDFKVGKQVNYNRPGYGGITLALVPAEITKITGNKVTIEYEEGGRLYSVELENGENIVDFDKYNRLSNLYDLDERFRKEFERQERSIVRQQLQDSVNYRTNHFFIKWYITTLLNNVTKEKKDTAKLLGLLTELELKVSSADTIDLPNSVTEQYFKDKLSSKQVILLPSKGEEKFSWHPNTDNPIGEQKEQYNFIIGKYRDFFSYIANIEEQLDKLIDNNLAKQYGQCISKNKFNSTSIETNIDNLVKLYYGSEGEKKAIDDVYSTATSKDKRDWQVQHPQEYFDKKNSFYGKQKAFEFKLHQKKIELEKKVDSLTKQANCDHVKYNYKNFTEEYLTSFQSKVESYLEEKSLCYGYTSVKEEEKQGIIESVFTELNRHSNKDTSNIIKSLDELIAQNKKEDIYKFKKSPENFELKFINDKDCDEKLELEIVKKQIGDSNMMHDDILDKISNVLNKLENEIPDLVSLKNKNFDSFKNKFDSYDESFTGEFYQRAEANIDYLIKLQTKSEQKSKELKTLDKSLEELKTIPKPITVKTIKGKIDDLKKWEKTEFKDKLLSGIKESRNSQQGGTKLKRHQEINKQLKKRSLRKNKQVKNYIRLSKIKPNKRKKSSKKRRASPNTKLKQHKATNKLLKKRSLRRNTQVKKKIDISRIKD